jgi:hypothetical protein
LDILVLMALQYLFGSRAANPYTLALVHV